MDKKNHQQLIESFQRYETFCRSMIDAYILIGLDGKIVKCNQLFSILVGKSQKFLVSDKLFCSQIDDNKLTNVTSKESFS